MNEEQQVKVFAPFTQGDDSTTRKYGGTGPGLTITKNLVELMGGRLQVESSVGIGSKFYFDLTFRTCDSDTVTGLPDSEVTAISEIKKPRFDAEVLVFEDNRMNQDVIIEHLSRIGINTVIAENGKIGVKIVEGRMKSNKKPFDLIFMDIHMPIMDGLEAMNKLTELGNTVPVVALTANIMSTDRDTYREHGMSEHLSKPFTSHELWACLLKYITPIGHATNTKEEAAAQSVEDGKLKMRLISNFLKDNQTKGREIRDAISSGDLKLAHRLAHTLKSVAGLVEQPELQKAAYTVERALSTEDIDSATAHLGVLETELAKSLAELSAVKLTAAPEKEIAPAADAINPSQMLKIVDKLWLLLEKGDSDCLNVIDGLRSIPASEKLIEQVEDYDFELAINTLEEIKRELEEQTV
jgi:CheY-like chemotaxis protein